MPAGTLIILIACQGAVPDGYALVADAVSPVTTMEASRAVGAAAFAGITFAADEGQAVDLAALTRTRRCLVRYTLPKSGFRGESRWGYVPRSTYDCEKPDDGEAALAAAKRWARSTTLGHYGAGDVTAPAVEAVHRTATSREALIAEASAWDLDFDVAGCVQGRTARYATRRSQLAAAQCATFSAPAKDAVEMKDALAEAERRARKRIADTPVRQQRSVDAALATTCQAASAGQALTIPGDTDAKADGLPLVWAAQVFTGELLTIYASAPDVDPILLLADGACGRVLEVNDDWRGRSSRVVHRVTADGDVTVIVRAAGGAPTGAVNLTVEVDGTAVLSTKQKADLEAFAGWAGAASDADVATTWRLGVADDLGGACLDEVLYGDAGSGQGRVAASAADDCFSYLEVALKAKKDAAAAQSLAGSLIGGIKGALK